MKDDLESKIMVKQDWIESEKGWGIRPDGISLHKTINDCKEFIKTYWSKMPDEVPYEYSKPCGDPCFVKVCDILYKKVLRSKDGIRLY